MPTLMTQPLFDEFCRARDELLSKYPDKIAGVFVPWAGEELLADGGLYYVGQATNDQGCPDEQKSFEDSIKEASDFSHKRHSLYGKPFWRYLNDLSDALLKRHAWECSSRWGWSNLMKLEYINNTPVKWPEEFIEPQRSANVNCLKTELSALKNSLIFVASGGDFGILFQAMPYNLSKHKELEDDGIHWWWDEDHKVLYIHGYHPGAAQRKNFYRQQLDSTIGIARRHLNWAKQ